jgi:hypothetical protein
MMFKRASDWSKIQFFFLGLSGAAGRGGVAHGFIKKYYFLKIRRSHHHGVAGKGACYVIVKRYHSP